MTRQMSSHSVNVYVNFHERKIAEFVTALNWKKILGMKYGKISVSQIFILNHTESCQNPSWSANSVIHDPTQSYNQHFNLQGMKELSHSPKQAQILVMSGRQRYHWSETQEKDKEYMDTESGGTPVRWLTVRTNIHKNVSNECNHHGKPLYYCTWFTTVNHGTYRTIKHLSAHKSV